MRQHLDAARVHVGDELTQRGELLARHGLGRRHVGDRLAGVAERGVHRVRQRMHGRRLGIAHHHHGAAAVRSRSLAIASSADSVPAGAAPLNTDTPTRGGERTGERSARRWS
ncbi:MAG: hypothetical protein R2712_28215 [Vicinamibacterales bacterium]